MQNNIIYRHPDFNDVNNLVKLEKEVWGEEMAADSMKWTSRISIFPEGTLVAQKNNKIVGSVVILLTKWNYPKGYFPTWSEATDNGYITNHDNNGNIIYGVNLTVIPKMQYVAKKLIKFPFELARQRGIPKGIMGGRIPSLFEYTAGSNIKINNNYVINMAKSDPTVIFFLRNGFKIISARENYFPNDQKSLGWGIILEGRA